VAQLFHHGRVRFGRPVRRAERWRRPVAAPAIEFVGGALRFRSRCFIPAGGWGGPTPISGPRARAAFLGLPTIWQETKNGMMVSQGCAAQKVGKVKWERPVPALAQADRRRPPDGGDIGGDERRSSSICVGEAHRGHRAAVDLAPGHGGGR